MFELKPLHKEAIPHALEKAERYRLLNEPAEAESICSDVLRIDPDNQQALVVLLLSLSDQIGKGLSQAVSQACELLPRVQDEYERAYYTGIIFERRAKAQLRQGRPGFGAIAYDLFRTSMSWYERAETLRPPGNDDATLRWNTCARLIMRNPDLRPSGEEPTEHPLE